MFISLQSRYSSVPAFLIRTQSLLSAPPLGESVSVFVCVVTYSRVPSFSRSVAPIHWFARFEMPSGPAIIAERSLLESSTTRWVGTPIASSSQSRSALIHGDGWPTNRYVDGEAVDRPTIGR